MTEANVEFSKTNSSQDDCSNCANYGGLVSDNSILPVNNVILLPVDFSHGILTLITIIFLFFSNI